MEIEKVQKNSFEMIKEFISNSENHYKNHFFACLEEQDRDEVRLATNGRMNANFRLSLILALCQTLDALQLAILKQELEAL